MMKVLAISDLHGYLPEIPKCDLLLLGGDYCSVNNREMQLRYLSGPFKEWLAAVPARHKVAIAGNHDFALQEWPDLFLDMPWIYLKDEMVTIEGVKIYGTPWTPAYGNWAFMKDDWKLAQTFQNIPEGLDILLSHGPVYQRLDRSNSGDNCGSRSLRFRVDKVKPNSFVSGHIHEAYGIEDGGDTRFYNVAYVDARNEPKNGPVDVPLKA